MSRSDSIWGKKVVGMEEKEERTYRFDEAAGLDFLRPPWVIFSSLFLFFFQVIFGDSRYILGVRGNMCLFFCFE